MFEIQTKAMPLLTDPPFVLLLCWLSAALGWRLLRTFGACQEGVAPIEMAVLSTALGLGLLQYVGFVLGVTGLLSPLAVWIVLLALVAWNLPTMLRLARYCLHPIRTFLPIPLWLGSGVVILALPLLVAFIQALTPPTDIDGTYYHLTAPLRWLQQGRMNYLPTLLHTNMPMGVDMLFLLAQAIWSDTAAKLIHYVLGVLALVAIFLLGRRVRGPLVGFAGVVVFLFGLPSARTLHLFGWAYVDLGIVMQLSCAALAWILWRRSEGRGWLWACALLAGFAATCKLTVACVGVVLALLTLLELRARQQPLAVAIPTAALFLVISLLPLLPWMGRAFALTGNPVYPVLSGLFPTRDWPREAGKAFERFFRYFVWGTGGSTLHWGQGKRSQLLFGCMGVVAVAAGIWLWRDRNRDTRMLIALSALLALASLWSTGLYLRYFLPLMPLVTIAVLARLPHDSTLVLSGRIAVLTLTLIVGGVYLREMRSSLQAGWQVATGSMSRQDYLRQNPLTQAYPMWEQINRTVPPDSRILLVGGRVSYYLKPYCYIAEAIYQHVIRMDTWENYLADLRREKISYLLLPPEGYIITVGMDYAPIRNEALFAEQLAAQYGRRIKTPSEDRFYQLSGF